MDFFGGLTELLDNIIPESDDIIGVFDSAAETLLGDRKTKKAGNVEGVQKADFSAPKSGLNINEFSSFNAEAIGQGIARGVKKTEALESVDPRTIQANWMSRLSAFASDDISDQKMVEKMVKKAIQKQV